MYSARKLQVDEWSYADSPDRVRPRKLGRWFRISPALFGAIGTIFLHTLVIQWLALGGFRTQKTVARPLQSADTGPSSNPAQSLVLVNAVSASVSPPIAVSMMTQSDSAKSLIKATPDKEPALPLLLLPLADEELAASAAGGGDEGEQARLYGLYTGQIRARIERAWRRPRSAVDAGLSEGNAADSESFRCRVQIVQDARGNVGEILLTACNGSSAWQQSLVVAIRQASPLPAPPSTSVFAESIALEFVGLPFNASSDDAEYQLVAHADAQSTNLTHR